MSVFRCLPIVLAALTPVRAPSVDLEAELGRLLDNQIRRQSTVVTGTLANSVADELLARLKKVATDLPYPPKVTLLESTDVSPKSGPGGHIYLSTALMSVPGFNRDELGAILAFQLSLIKQRVSYKQATAKVGLNLLANLLDTKESELTKLIGQALVSRLSQDQIRQADRDTQRYLRTAGFKATGLYSLLCRFEVLAKTNPTPFAEYQQNYPPLKKRLQAILGDITVERFGRDIRQAFIPKALAADDVFWVYDHFNSEWETAYRRDIGFEIYNLNNVFAQAGFRGQCTWLMAGLWPVIISKRDAKFWPTDARAKGYGTGKAPKIGAIAVWPSSVGGGSGHLGLVVGEPRPDGRIPIVDCNWSTNPDKRVRYRLVKLSAIVEYIYWPNGATEPPPGFPGYLAPGRNEIMILKDEFHLGDDEAKSEMVVYRDFRLTEADLKGRQSAVLRLWVKATPRKDPIVGVNNVETERIVASVGAWREYERVIKLDALHVGTNLFFIRTIAPDWRESFDECEVKEVRLILR